MLDKYEDHLKGLIVCSCDVHIQSVFVGEIDSPLCSQVKSVKPCLKQLQQCIQTISTLHDDEILPSNPADLFHWLPKEHMCVLVYLVRPLFV